MKLLKLSVEGFMGFRGRTELQLDGLGLAHIAGRNEDDPANDSNGSGKSTILEAVTWALFGEGLPRPQGNAEQGVRADEVLNDRRKKQCRVAVDLRDDDGTWYQVERWRKYKGPGEARQSNGVRLCVEDAEGCPQQCHEALDEKETNRLIVERLGLDRDIWCRGVVFGQEAAFNFCEATAKERTAILTTVMGVEVIDTWLEKCRDEKRALTNRMAESNGKLEMARQSLERAEQEHPEQQQVAWAEAREKELQALDIRLADMAAHGKKLVYDLEVLRAQPPPKAEEPPRLARPDDSAVRRSEEVQQQALAVRARLDTEESLLLRQIEKLERMELGECPTCLQPVTAAHRDPCLATARQAAQDLRSSDRWADALQQLRSAEAALEATRGAFQAAEAEALAAVQSASASSLEAQEKWGRWELGCYDLQRRLDHARQEWKRENDRRTRLAEETNPLDGLVAQHQEKLTQLRWELAALEDEQKGIGSALDVALWWEKELPRFRTWLFDAVVDTLAAEANRWLRIMSGGVIWVQISTTKQVGKWLRDELDVQVYRWQPDGSVTSRSYRTWSGGEKRRVSLAVDLGLSRLLADRASKAYRLLCLDEIDRHLDAQGREGLRQVLDELRREKETLLTVTHDPEFRASFDTEILVTKRGGESTLEVKGAQGNRQTAE